MPQSNVLLGFDRILMVREPWASLLIDNRKIWEMRSTRTTFRGVFGLAVPGTGLIFGKASLIDCLDPLTDERYFDHETEHRIPPSMQEAKRWRYPWVVENATRFASPVSYVHPPGAVIWVRLS